jgi:hypothetical protein
MHSSSVPGLWSPCHQGMTFVQVVDGGDGIQIWCVAANILNIQSRRAESKLYSSLGVGRGANNSSQQKNKLFTILWMFRLLLKILAIINYWLFMKLGQKLSREKV